MLRLKNLPVVVMGMGISNSSALKLLAREQADITVVALGDPKDWKNIDFVKALIPESCCLAQEAERDVIEKLTGCELVILSPGISKHHPLLEKAQLERSKAGKTALRLWCEIELGFQFCSNTPIIAITGTNGKTTCSMLMSELLKAQDKQVFLGGNIGVPLCELILSEAKVDYIVLELSSFQLELIETFHAHIAIFLNISDSHGERYQKLTDYFTAKTNIVNNMNQDDLLIFKQDQSVLSKWGQQNREFQRLEIPMTEQALKAMLPENITIHNLKLLGVHNLSNLVFCLKACQFLLPLNKQTQRAIDSFEAPHFRLEKIGQFEGFNIINDGKSTNWNATIMALKAIPGDLNTVLMIGGSARKVNEQIPDELLDIASKKVFHIIFFGEVGLELDLFFKSTSSDLSSSYFKSLKQALIATKETMRDARKKFPGIKKYILFSPAYPSFDEFQNYIERGTYFNSYWQEKEK